MSKTTVRKQPVGYNERFYTLSDKDGKPIITVCLMHNKTLTKFARGVAICSPTENPRKTKGRDKAHGRAVEAASSHLSENVVRREEALTQLQKVGAFDKGLRRLTECKSAFFDNVKGLTSIERSMLEIDVPAVPAT